MDLESAAEHAFEILDAHLAADPSPEDSGLIVQYVAPAPSPSDARWIQVAFSVEVGMADDPETIASARAALQALLDQTGWTLANEQPDFEAKPAESAPDQISVTWWIHEA